MLAVYNAVFAAFSKSCNWLLSFSGFGLEFWSKKDLYNQLLNNCKTGAKEEKEEKWVSIKYDDRWSFFQQIK